MTTKQPPSASATASPWDEQRLESSLQRLKELHLKLRALRTTIPRMVEPISSKQRSPEAIFSSFAESVMTAREEVGAFKELMTADKTKQILEHAKQSRLENPRGIKPWRARDDPSWVRPGTEEGGVA